jgi:hypothetical protein
MDRDNGFAMARGQPAGRAFPKEMPRLLLGLSARINLDGDALENQFLSSDLIFLSNFSNAKPTDKSWRWFWNSSCPASCRASTSFVPHARKTWMAGT